MVSATNSGWPRRIQMAGIALLCFLSLAGLLLFVLADFPLVPVAANSRNECMAPAFRKDYRYLAFTWAYWFSSPEPGEVVAFRYPWNDMDTGYTTRVIPCSGQDPRGGAFRDLFARNPDLPFICVALDDPECSYLEDPNPVPVSVLIGKGVFIYWPPGAAGSIPPKGEAR